MFIRGKCRLFIKAKGEISLFEFFIVFIAYIAKGITGFANTLIYNSLMSFRDSTAALTPISLLHSVPTNIFMLWKERKHISLKTAIPPTLFVVAGLIPGTFFLKTADQTLLKLIMGLVIIFVGIETFIRLCRPPDVEGKKQNKLILTLIGIITGVLCGLYGIGAFLTAYVSRTTKNMNEFRGNLAFIFTAECVFRVLIYAFTGLLSYDIIIRAVKLLPAVAAGMLAGVWLSKYIKEQTVKQLVCVLLILMGLSTFINNLLIII